VPSENNAERRGAPPTLPRRAPARNAALPAVGARFLTLQDLWGAGPLKYLLQLAAVAAIYFVVAKLGLAWASVNPSATPIWPPTGIALAAALLFGLRIWPAIFIAALIANATTAGSIYTSTAIAVGNTLESVVGCWIINRWSEGLHTFDSPAGVAKFAFICFAPATMISATVGVGSLSLAGFAEWSKFSSIWLTWWMGDLAGALVIAPVIVLWSASIGRPGPSQDVLETVAIFIMSMAVGVIAFSPLLEQTVYRAALAFLAIVPLMWAALRRGQRDTATVALIVSCFAVWGTALHGGPFARADLNESFLLVLTFTISISVPSLTLSADVATRKRHEEHVNAVMRELSHRSKNLLAIIQSVARQVARQTDNFDNFEPAFSARLAALAGTHDLLVAGGWSGVDIRDLVRTQLLPFIAENEMRVSAKGPELILNPKAAEQLGLALHELATNAAKYGALSCPKGTVEIAWELEDKGSALNFSWKERNGPTRGAAPEHRGFGTVVLTKAVPFSLDGRASLEFPPEGATWVIVAPLDQKTLGRKFEG
jgi:two-component sensor histidine kinase